MSEEEWLACIDPSPMLRFLQERHTSERKLRLLACACCRQIWHLLPDERSRHVVVMAERFADGQANLLELTDARGNSLKAPDDEAARAAYWTASARAGGPLDNVFSAAAGALARQAVQEARSDRSGAWTTMQAAGVRDQVALIRDAIGNPFRPVLVYPNWLAWAGGIVVQLAEGIYEDRAFDRMPVLGDALEEAGCVEEAILGHCRHGKEHVRGCWVVDAILGKE